MSSHPQPEPSLIAACLFARKGPGGESETTTYRSVLQAFQRAISRFQDSPGETCIILAGELRPDEEADGLLGRRAQAIAEKISQPGLFLSLAAQDLVRDRLLMAARFEDFGILDTGDPLRAERIFAVIHPDLPEPDLPHQKIAGNCPRPHKSFVGRHRQVDELQDMILQRLLVTLVGPPGVGKTATALHVARSFADEYEDGVWWFSVEDRASLDELIQSMVREPGFVASLGGPVDAVRLADALLDKRAVIVLDGCEGMLEGVSLLCREILARCKKLTLLLTSTKGLGIDEEHLYKLEPMSLPQPGEEGQSALIASEALSLFFERAAQAGQRLPLDEPTLAATSKICERLDGLPVAIEIVAASLRTTSLNSIAEELVSDLVPLSSRSFGGHGRRASLERALSMSYGTLDRGQQEMLQRLALFRGEWRVSAAAEIWGGESDAGELRALHQDLVECSWLAFNPDSNCYRMLHTIKAFCWEQAGESAQTMKHHFSEQMASLGARIFAALQSGTAAEAAEEDLSRHYSDLAFSLEIALKSPGTRDVASKLMQTMVNFWLQRNLLADAEQLSKAYLKDASGIEAARALVMIGVVHLRRRKLNQAAEVFAECLDLAREVGNKGAEAVTLVNLGLTMSDKADYDRALDYYTRGFELLRNAKQQNHLCAALCNAAYAELQRTQKCPPSQRETHLSRAEGYIKEAESLQENIGPICQQALEHAKAGLLLARGSKAEAESHLMRAISICVKHDLRHEAGEATEKLAEINLDRGLGPTAAKLLGLARQIRRESGKTRTETEMEHFGRLISLLHRQVDRDRAEKLMRYGERLNLAEILTPAVFNA